MEPVRFDVFVFIYIPCVVTAGTQSALGEGKLFLLIYQVQHLRLCISTGQRLQRVSDYICIIVFSGEPFVRNTVGAERAPELSFKAALALALISARMMGAGGGRGGLAALSVNPCCLKAGVSTALSGICLVVL